MYKKKSLYLSLCFLFVIILSSCSNSAKSQLDPTEKWWLKPQTYHNGEGPDQDLIPSMNISVLHDWSSLTVGFSPDADLYWKPFAIIRRWRQAHAKGMRVEAVLSIIDMWFVEYGPEDDVYSSSGINLYDEHIEYDDPVSFVGCTNHPGWQSFTRERIFTAIDWGADGIIIDDYEGSSRWTSGVTSGMGGLENGPGGCFCDACEAGFKEYLKEKYTSDELKVLGVNDINTFDYSEFLIEQGWTIEELGAESRKFQGWDSDAEIIIPFYQDYADYQNIEIVKFLEQLKKDALAYAKENYGRELAWSINAGELTYGAHKVYSQFDQNVGAIWQFGYPPKGSEGYHYRLGYSINGTHRLREVFRFPVVVEVMNTYQTQNLWLIKCAEAYANKGALIEYDYITIEGAPDEVAYASLTNDAEAKNRYNTFYLDHSDVFDFTALQSLAKTAVLYSSASVHYDMNRHIQSFNGICEILTDLNIQFDPLFMGDGLTYPDLDAQSIKQYDVLFLPNVYSLTEHQSQMLLDYMAAGGNVIALGDFAITDEYNQTFSNDDLLSLLGKGNVSFGLGSFSQLREEMFKADGLVDDYVKDIASFYFDHYIEDNHPAVEEILYRLYPEETKSRVSDETAKDIRNDMLLSIENVMDTRVVQSVSTENIAAQQYLQNNTNQLVLHLLNYNYQLETDTVLKQNDIAIEFRPPEGFDVKKVTLISPDFEGQETLAFQYKEGLLSFTVPEIYIWDVIIIE